jgi:hypothetical protein
LFLLSGHADAFGLTGELQEPLSLSSISLVARVRPFRWRVVYAQLPTLRERVRADGCHGDEQGKKALVVTGVTVDGSTVTETVEPSAVSLLLLLLFFAFLIALSSLS